MLVFHKLENPPLFLPTLNQKETYLASKVLVATLAVGFTEQIRFIRRSRLVFVGDCSLICLLAVKALASAALGRASYRVQAGVSGSSRIWSFGQFFFFKEL